MASTQQPEPAATHCQVVFAPARPAITGKKTIFLAGTTSPTGEPDWRETLTAALRSRAVSVFNPFRADWNWEDDMADPRFREQVEWELDMQAAADLVVFYFHPVTLAPVSLLELGLRARVGRAIVVCPGGPGGYKRRGNVQAVCARFGLEIVGSGEELEEAVLRWLDAAGVGREE